MSSTRPVPETRLMLHHELSADDAWHTLRRHGGMVAGSPAGRGQRGEPATPGGAGC